MRAIAKLISEVPAEAWQPIPAPGHEPAPTPANRRHRRSLTRSRALAAAVVLACLAIGFAVGALINRGPGGPAPAPAPQAATATLRPLTGQPAAAIARAQLTSAGRIVISFSRLPRPGAGRFYEAWLMTSTTKLIPVASFRPDAAWARASRDEPARARGRLPLHRRLAATNRGRPRALRRLGAPRANRAARAPARLNQPQRLTREPDGGQRPDREQLAGERAGPPCDHQSMALQAAKDQRRTDSGRTRWSADPRVPQ